LIKKNQDVTTVSLHGRKLIGRTQQFPEDKKILVLKNKEIILATNHYQEWRFDESLNH